VKIAMNGIMLMSLANAKKQFLQNCLLAVLTNALHVGQKQRATHFCKKCFSNYTEEKMLEMLNKSSKENVEFGESAAIERQRQEDGKCIVCGEDAPNGSLCRDCYYEMLDYKDTFDKNAKVFELKDYYLALSQQMVDF